MGDRIVVMKDGLVQQIADPLNLYDKPKNRFVAGFSRTPSNGILRTYVTCEIECRRCSSCPR
jgi:multiple sugar transport system ATP-binding protein